MGSGINRMRNATAEANIPAPSFEINSFFTITFRRPVGISSLAQVTAQVTAQVAKVLEAAKTASSREELQEAANIAHREHFRKTYLSRLLSSGWLRLTFPDKPKSSKQRYVLTAKGTKALEDWKKKK